jgi:Mn2+/Fe2+ NRAMP family transporter
MPLPNFRLAARTRRKPPAGPRGFYAVFVASMAIGMALDFFDIIPIKALYWTAILNGLLVPFLLVGILIIACNRTIMQKLPSSMVSRIVFGVTALLMFGAAIGMFVFLRNMLPLSMNDQRWV